MNCPTANIIFNCSAKPTQGKVFALHRNTIVGVSEKEHGMHK